MSADNKNNSIKPITLKEHGNYIFATLDGVDFTASGVMVDKTTQVKSNYGASIKLKFIIKDTFFKEVNGIKISTMKANSVVIKIPTQDDKIPSLVAKYNSLISQDLFIKYNLTDGHSITVQDENEIISIK